MQLAWIRKTSRRLLGVTLLLLLLGIVVSDAPFPRLVAQSTVRTTLCDSTSGPELTITTPQSDSVVAVSQIEVEASTLRTTQVDVYINNAYSHSVAVDPDQLFQTTVALVPGTNTIRLEAYFACNHTAQTFSLVVTYEPKVQPSPGEDTDTNIPNQGGGSIPPTISNPGFTSPTPPEKPSIVERIGHNLIIYPGSPESRQVSISPVRIVTSWVALAGVIIGIVALVKPVYALKSLRRLFGVVVDDTSRKYQRVVRMIAVAVLVILVLILQY